MDRRPRPEVDRPDREGDLDQRDAEHDRARPPDVVGVADDDAVVDDVGVQRGQVERRGGLHRLEHDDSEQHAPVGREVRAQESDQHAGS